jgi:hypothetical protein
MKVGDLVTVLPAEAGIFLVIKGPQLAHHRPEQENLGPLWILYNEELGIAKMHEKWIKIINNEQK